MDNNLHDVQGIAPVVRPAVIIHKAQKTSEYSSGLLRYHSAPPSAITGLLDDDDEDGFYQHRADCGELDRILDEGISPFSSFLGTKGTDEKAAGAAAAGSALGVIANQGEYCVSHDRVVNSGNPDYFGTVLAGRFSQDQLHQTSLSAILEHGNQDLPCKYSGADLSPNTCPSLRRTRTDLGTYNPVLHPNPTTVNPSLPTNSNLLRQDGLEAKPLQGEAFGEAEEKMRIYGSHLPSSTAQVNLNPLRVPGLMRSNSLLRQSSLPADLLSKYAMEEDTVGASPSITGSSYGSSHGWPADPNQLAILDVRKRGRGFAQDNCSWMTTNAPVHYRSVIDVSSPSSSYVLPSISNMDNLEKSHMDSLLMKARAKRGCATHPRSIAERVRRTKINERIKKLQDLLPNLDKQSSTAEMLDEVVEYVKHLQRLVQELSLKRALCDGSCKQEKNSPH